MTQALYRKWRPGRFDAVVGQEHVTRTLQNAIAAGRVGHAYLFAGPRGTGKTTTARLLAKAVNCLDPDPRRRPCDTCANCRAIADGRFLDLIEIDAASNTGVDDIRDLRDKINFSPSQGRYKVYVVDECHMLSTAAFNALLKTLEEPPPHALFILATTEEHKVPLTIKSRCQPFNFRLLTTQEIQERLAWMAKQEGLVVEPEALTLVAQQGAGSLRDAESLLDQLVAAPGATITLERAQKVLGTASSAAVRALTTAWLDGNGAAGLRVIHDSLAVGVDARQFARQMVAYLRSLLLLQTVGPEAMAGGSVEQQAAMLEQARRADRPMLVAAIKGFNYAATTPATGFYPQLPLELAFMELLPVVGSNQLAVASSHLPVVVRPATNDGGRPAGGSELLAVTSAPPVAAGDGRPAVVNEQQPVRPEVATIDQPPAVDQPIANDPLPVATLDTITGRWREVMARLGERNKNLPALLASCTPLAVEGDVVVLGFKFPLIKDKFESNRAAVQGMNTVLTNLLGSSLTVRCVMAAEYTPPVTIQKDDFRALAHELGGVVRES
ncbi:MAG: DNA polymerase III subunit gamma/tau [Chloroflexota bacterium]